MPRIQRTAPGGNSGQIVAEGAGIDPTGKTDSTTGLLKSYQKAINENKSWYCPGGTYVIGEGGTGLDFSTLEYAPTQTPEPHQMMPPQLECAVTAWFRAHPNLKANPLVKLAPPPTFGEFNQHRFLFGRLSHAAIHTIGNIENGSKIVKKIAHTAPLELFVGKKVEGAGIPAAATLVKVINSTEVELSEAATSTTAEIPIRCGEAQSTLGACLLIGPGVVDGYIEMATVEEGLYGQLLEAKTAEEVNVGWVANNTVKCQLFSFNGTAQYLKGPAESVSFGVQGNRFFNGEMENGEWGIIIDGAVKDNEKFNAWTGNVIEVMSQGCILDRDGFSNIQYNYLGVITGAPKKNYVLAEGAEGVPYVRAYMLHGYEAPGHEAIDLINYKEKVGTTTLTTPGVTGSSVRNEKGRPTTAVVQLSPKPILASAATPIGKAEIHLTEADQKGYTVGKPVTFTKLPAASTSFKEGVPYFIVAAEFEPTSATKTTETKINLTGAKAKLFLNKTRVIFTKLPAGVTTLTAGKVYWVKGESEEGFEVSASERGAAIKVEGELVAAETKVQRFALNAFELAKEPGGTPMLAEGAELPAGLGTQFTTPNLHWQLTGNTPVGQTIFNMRGVRAKFALNVTTTYPRFVKAVKVTTGVTKPVGGAAPFYALASEIEPTGETEVGKEEIQLKETGGVAASARFPNGTEIQFQKLPAGVTTPKTGTTYFVVEAGANGFKFSASEGGAALAIAGAALKPSETRVIRPNCFELSESEGGTPIKVEGAELLANSTEFNAALTSVEKAPQSLIEGEGVFPITIPVNSLFSLGVYECEAKIAASGGT